ncbi:GNAT family N-acetyltransferase [Actinomarinicola tropica]|uniref:GNAT family N-acetyltransferase n=1 Tax=Actinomarinicola tropica TaxID=2789776 RepID=A0A5Q2RCE9_9ACTN|nr:GNAT family N-acetyltransferase [Actinomarinicola tropica]QGG94569.1 GNAT family N-acetyltransferase [Actinomarinicola tropica]
MRERRALPDGSWVVVRSVEPADRAQLRDGFAALSSESRRRRFLTGVTRLDEDTLDYLTEVDHVGHEAIGVLTDEGEGLGIGRYVRCAAEPDAAEVAITVRDDQQGRGIGTLLLTTLAEEAARHGIRRFVTYVLWENRPMVDLLVAVGGRGRPSEPGLARIDIGLPEPALQGRRDAR